MSAEQHPATVIVSWTLTEWRVDAWFPWYDICIDRQHQDTHKGQQFPFRCSFVYNCVIGVCHDKAYILQSNCSFSSFHMGLVPAVNNRFTVEVQGSFLMSLQHYALVHEISLSPNDIIHFSEKTGISGTWNVLSMIRRSSCSNPGPVVSNLGCAVLLSKSYMN